jgi:hypothetical protein
MKSHFKSRLPIYSIGPLLPPGYSRHPVESSESKNGQMERDVQVFLNGMQTKYGESSVVFVGFCSYHWTNTSNIHGNFFQISFGTIFWPTVPEYIDEVIQAFTEKGVPFVHSLLDSFVLS